MSDLNTARGEDSTDFGRSRVDESAVSEPTEAGPAPLLSVGLAVFNGERFLAEAIESILAQTFADFELIISDNASTDRTAEICASFAAGDPRIRYSRNPTNIGGANNENLTFRLARGQYFRWAAHDDICAPDLFEKCVAVLEADPDVVLCHTVVVAIDDEGTTLRTISRNNAADDRTHVRFASIANSRDFCEETYGVIRSSTLRTTRLQQNYTASDRTLLCELALHGRFHQVPEPLFRKRFHAGNVYTDWRARMAWFDPALEGKITFPFWMQLRDYVATIRRVPLEAGERTRCYLALGPWLMRYGKNLLKDVIVAAFMLTRSRTARRQLHARHNIWS